MHDSTTPVVTAAVLTGGNSRRMGRTKALIEIDGVTMASRVARATLAGGCRSVVLIGGSPAELAPLGIDVITDLHPGEGPVGAILTALAAAPTDAEAVLVLPCDVPFVDAPLVRRLIAGLAGHDADVAVARTSRREPGCAVWRVSCARRVTAMFAEGERAVHRVLDSLETVEIPVDASRLVNVNAPGDLPADDTTSSTTSDTTSGPTSDTGADVPRGQRAVPVHGDRNGERHEDGGNPVHDDSTK